MAAASNRCCAVYWFYCWTILNGLIQVQSFAPIIPPSCLRASYRLLPPASTSVSRPLYSILDDDDPSDIFNDSNEEEPPSWNLEELKDIGEADLGVFGEDKVDQNDPWVPESTKEKARGDHLRSAKAIPDEDDPNKKKKTENAAENDPHHRSYTPEQEDLIRRLGGTKERPSVRQSGYIGDSTLLQISQHYSVSLSYLADVLCMWGAPVPINMHDRLGDLANGEQIFAILEAINSIDPAIINDRYSIDSIAEVCEDNGLDLKDAFAYVMKQGWSLPFGVQTCLRLEQERQLLEELSGENEDEFDL